MPNLSRAEQQFARELELSAEIIAMLPKEIERRDGRRLNNHAIRAWRISLVPRLEALKKGNVASEDEVAELRQLIKQSQLGDEIPMRKITTKEQAQDALAYYEQAQHDCVTLINNLLSSSLKFDNRQDVLDSAKARARTIRENIKKLKSWMDEIPSDADRESLDDLNVLIDDLNRKAE